MSWGPRSLPVAVAVTVVAASGACGSPNTDLRQPVGVSTVTAAPDVPVPSPPSRADAPRAPAAPAPPDFVPATCPTRLPSFVFPSDSAVITPAQDFELNHLAQCLLFGPLQRVNIIAVGHADPVGDPGYNLALAEARAAKIKAFLVAHGVPGVRVLATSVGARQSDASMPGRRVDLVVAP